MDIKIFYQDFSLNAIRFSNESLVLKPDKASYIWDVIIQTAKFDAQNGEEIYVYMNSLNIPPGHRYRSIFETAGHTSMSVGDFIFIPDERTIWMVAATGWRIWQTTELIEMFGEQIFNILNGYGLRHETRTFL